MKRLGWLILSVEVKFEKIYEKCDGILYIVYMNRLFHLIIYLEDIFLCFVYSLQTQHRLSCHSIRPDILDIPEFNEFHEV